MLHTNVLLSLPFILVANSHPLSQIKIEQPFRSSGYTNWSIIDVMCNSLIIWLVIQELRQTYWPIKVADMLWLIFTWQPVPHQLSKQDHKQNVLAFHRYTSHGVASWPTILHLWIFIREPKVMWLISQYVIVCSTHPLLSFTFSNK